MARIKCCNFGVHKYSIREVHVTDIPEDEFFNATIIERCENWKQDIIIILSLISINGIIAYFIFSWFS